MELKLRSGIPTKKSIIEVLYNLGITSFSFSGYREQRQISFFWQTKYTQENIHKFIEIVNENSNIIYEYRPYESPLTGMISIKPVTKQ